MDDGKIRCPFCEDLVSEEVRGAQLELCRIEDATCGPYFISCRERSMHLGDESKYQKFHRQRICALLKERSLKGLPEPVLVFGETPQREFSEGVVVRADELLDTWPRTIPKRIERSFCCLVRAGDAGDQLGRRICFNQDDWRQYIPFAFDFDDAGYIVSALREYDWITTGSSTNPYKARITPTGWAKFNDLSESGSDRSNPVFVAMWFGGDERGPEMDSLYEKAIAPAVKAAGYHVMRADSKQHNDFIMGRIIGDIRRSPFVVAELIGNSNGVYYEAGFASGLGTPVIWCVNSTEGTPHFDVSGINQVRWAKAEDLRTRLEDRILGTIGKGPHAERENGK